MTRDVGVSARPHYRVLGKQPSDTRYIPNEPESKRQRQIAGLDVCQEAEPGLISPEEWLYHIEEVAV